MKYRRTSKDFVFYLSFIFYQNTIVAHISSMNEAFFFLNHLQFECLVHKIIEIMSLIIKSNFTCILVDRHSNNNSLTCRRTHYDFSTPMACTNVM